MDDNRDAADALAAVLELMGARRHLLKPVDMSDLASALEQLSRKAG